MDIIWRVGEGINGEERKGCRNRNEKKNSRSRQSLQKRKGDVQKRLNQRRFWKLVKI